MNLPGGVTQGLQGQTHFNPTLQPVNQPLGGGTGTTGILPVARVAKFWPFHAALGIVPEANWHLLANATGGTPVVPVNGQDARSPSMFWHFVMPSNTLQLTWQNVLLDRDTNTPVSVQMEVWPSGRFTYRYDLSRCGGREATALPDGGTGTTGILPVEGVTIGASFAGNTWATNSLPTNVTSMAFYPLSEEDIFKQDRDGDGIRLIDEFFVYGTDPMLWDSDFDGLPDGVEVANGTNPAGRDSDNDGLVDGSDPDPASATPLDDLDGDGIPDAYENHWFGDTNIVDSTDAFGANGFNVGFGLASGINPTVSRACQLASISAVTPTSPPTSLWTASPLRARFT